MSFSGISWSMDVSLGGGLIHPAMERQVPEQPRPQIGARGTPSQPLL